MANLDTSGSGLNVVHVVSFEKFVILNPKRESEAQAGRASWYPYYAGFSLPFAQSLLASAKLDQASSVIDPWNGSGTTTAAAAGIGHFAFGYDLNPVMVLAAKARMLSKREKNSLVPIAQDIVAQMKGPGLTDADDPLATWFVPRSAAYLRGLEIRIQGLLICHDAAHNASQVLKNVEAVSDLAAFFYVALFRTVRTLMQAFTVSNPTWIKRPSHQSQRLRPEGSDIKNAFLGQVASMVEAFAGDSLAKDCEATIAVGSFEALPLGERSVDFVLSSPPYCTRIDYAVATLPELAVLGYRIDTEFDELRRSLIGTSTVPKEAPSIKAGWGKTCRSFLEQLENHTSKASESYYLKNHLQYFNSLSPCGQDAFPWWCHAPMALPCRVTCHG